MLSCPSPIPVPVLFYGVLYSGKTHTEKEPTPKRIYDVEELTKGLNSISMKPGIQHMNHKGVPSLVNREGLSGRTTVASEYEQNSILVTYYLQQKTQNEKLRF